MTDSNFPESQFQAHSFSGTDIRVIAVLPTILADDSYLRNQAWQSEAQQRYRNSISEILDRTITNANPDINQIFGDDPVLHEVTPTLDEWQSRDRVRQPDDFRFLEIGNLNSISVSIYREKRPVRALGHIYAKGYTRSTRTIAGSMVFTVLNKGALRDLIGRINMMSGMDYYADNPTHIANPTLADQIPPLNIIVVATNEYGQGARLGLYGIEFFNEGLILSVEDLVTENTFEFVARHIEPLESLEDINRSLGNYAASNLGNTIESYLDDPMLKDYHELLLNRATSTVL